MTGDMENPKASPQEFCPIIMEYPSPEAQAAATELADNITTWLGTLMSQRDNALPLAEGILLEGEPRISTIEMQPGASLTGDNTTTPLSLQIVRARQEGAEVITVEGINPLISLVYGDPFDIRRQETRASFKLQNDENYFSYEIKGDGSVIRSFRNKEGVHQMQRLYKADEIAMASEAFRLIVQDITPEA